MDDPVYVPIRKTDETSDKYLFWKTRITDLDVTLVEYRMECLRKVVSLLKSRVLPDDQAQDLLEYLNVIIYKMLGQNREAEMIKVMNDEEEETLF